MARENALPPVAAGTPQSMTQRWWTIVVTVRMMVVLATIGLTDGGSSSSSSRLLDSHELLVGTWETTIKLARPRQRSDLTRSSQLRSIMLRPKNPNRRSTSTARECALHLFQNFTCVLEPKEKVSANDQGPFRHDRPEPPRLYGSWKVHPNPYCSTDRFYDTVEFAFSSSSNDTSSSSRATTTDAAVGNTGHDDDDDDDDDARNMASAGDLVMVGRCRLTGHYSPGRLFFRARMPYAQGRLSHGILLQCRHDKVGLPPQPPRRRQKASTLSDGGGETTTAPAGVERRSAKILRASFVGRRSIASEDTLYDLDEAEDRQLFGY